MGNSLLYIAVALLLPCAFFLVRGIKSYMSTSKYSPEAQRDLYIAITLSIISAVFAAL